MIAHRMLGKTQFVGDLPVAEAFDHEFHVNAEQFL